MKKTNKTVVTNPTDALTIFKQYMSSTTDTPIYTTGKGKSAKKYYAVRQVVSWYNKNNKSTLDRGWFGRALNASAKIKVAKASDTRVYSN